MTTLCVPLINDILTDSVKRHSPLLPFPGNHPQETYIEICSNQHRMSISKQAELTIHP